MRKNETRVRTSSLTPTSRAIACYDIDTNFTRQVNKVSSGSVIGKFPSIAIPTSEHKIFENFLKSININKLPWPGIKKHLVGSCSYRIHITDNEIRRRDDFQCHTVHNTCHGNWSEPVTLVSVIESKEAQANKRARKHAQTPHQVSRKSINMSLQTELPNEKCWYPWPTADLKYRRLFTGVQLCKPQLSVRVFLRNVTLAVSGSSSVSRIYLLGVCRIHQCLQAKTQDRTLEHGHATPPQNQQAASVRPSIRFTHNRNSY
jgi:hypothetical protein